MGLVIHAGASYHSSEADLPDVVRLTWQRSSSPMGYKRPTLDVGGNGEQSRTKRAKAREGPGPSVPPGPDRRRPGRSALDADARRGSALGGPWRRRQGASKGVRNRGGCYS